MRVELDDEAERVLVEVEGVVARLTVEYDLELAGELLRVDVLADVERVVVTDVAVRVDAGLLERVVVAAEEVLVVPVVATAERVEADDALLVELVDDTGVLVELPSELARVDADELLTRVEPAALTLLLP